MVRISPCLTWADVACSSSANRWSSIERPASLSAALAFMMQLPTAWMLVKAFARPISCTKQMYQSVFKYVLPISMQMHEAGMTEKQLASGSAGEKAA